MPMMTLITGKIPSAVVRLVPRTKSFVVSEDLLALRSLNKLHEGQRGFLIGGGPSLKTLQESGFDFTRLSNDIRLGINKAYKLLELSYLVFGDEIFQKTFFDELEKVECLKFAPNDIMRGKVLPNLRLLRRGSNYQEVLPRGLDGPVSFINNTGVAGLRILYCLGCNPIYLLGVDLGSNTNGETHFHMDYESLKRPVPKDRYKAFYTEYVRTIHALRTRNVSVISCSPASLLNTLIPYVPIATLFP
jgi:hypothetical protein